MSRILDALKQIDSSSASKPRAAKPLTPVDLDEIARRRPLSDTSSLGPTAAAVGLIPDLDKLESAVSGGDADLASDGDADVPEIAIECDAVADAETDEVVETDEVAERDDVADPLFAIDETPAAPAGGDDPLEQLLGSDDTPEPFVGSGEVLDPVFGTDIESVVDVEAEGLGSPATEILTEKFVLKEIAADEAVPGEISAAGADLTFPSADHEDQSGGPVEAFAPATQSLPLPPSLLVSRFDEPVQAARPEGPPPEAKPDLFGDDQRLAGAYSDLLDNLDTILPGQLPVRLSIGSAQARAGTHTIVVQLGHSLVQRHGQDVLLIDGDFASRSLSIGTGAGTNRGLLDVLSGSNALHEVTVACGADQLHLLPTGQGSHDDIDCLREAISALFEDVKQHFAFAVIDVGSAVHAVSSGLLQQSDAALLLLQLGTTPTHLAASTVASWQRQGTRLIGSVLCDLSL